MSEGNISEELSEPERRKLVKNIAERGTQGRAVKETVVQPSYDYAAAAEAAAVADPVELPPAAMDEVAGGVNQMAGDAERYAEAQRAIFARGRDRELEYGNEFYDRKAQQHRATNSALDAMAVEIAELKASGSGRGRGSVTDESGPTGGMTDLLNDLHPIQAERTEDAIIGFNDAWGELVTEAINVGVTNGFTYQEVANAIRESMREQGVSAREVEDYLVGIERIYGGMFAPDMQGEAPRVGPYVQGAGDGVARPDYAERGYLPWESDPRNPNYSASSTTPPGSGHPGGVD